MLVDESILCATGLQPAQTKNPDKRVARRYVNTLGSKSQQRTATDTATVVEVGAQV